MMEKVFVAILLSLVYGTLALNENLSPVLLFKNKENTKVIENSAISATTKLSQRDFENRVGSLLVDQKIIIFVFPDLSPEDFGSKNEQNIKAFQNIAHETDIVEYIPFVENAVDNKLTQGNDVVDASVSTTNDLEPKPSSNAKVIVVKLPGYHEPESKYHYLARCDRAMYGVSQKYKDAIFILSSEKNSRLQQQQQQQQEHLRKRRAADDPTPIKYNDTNVLVYAKGFFKHHHQKSNPKDTSIAINEITSTKNGNIINVSFKSEYPITLVFNYDTNSKIWFLNTTESSLQDKKPLNMSLEMVVPSDFSYSCTSGVTINVNDGSDVEAVYFNGFQIQLNFDGQMKMDKFADSYDCIGFTSAPIWAGLFVTFLLLGIIAAGISYILDIRTMDRFDDPKGKTITVNASE